MLQQLQSLVNTSEQCDLQKADFVAAARSFSFDEQARIVPPTSGGFSSAPLAMTEHSLRQVCSKLGAAVFGKGTSKGLPHDYLSAIPKDLLADNLNRHLTASNGNKWMVRGYGESARAVLAGNYPGGTDAAGDFENTQYLRAVTTLAEGQLEQFPDMKLIRPTITADDLHIKMTWRDVDTKGDGGNGNYGVGVYIGNGEIGNRKLTVYPLIQRTSCTNSIIFSGENGLEMVHRGSLNAMRIQFKAAIGRIFSASAELLDKMIAAEEQTIPDFEATLAGLALKHGWAEPVRDGVFIGTEGKQTRAAIVNGVTYAAHTAVGDAGEQVEMEILGGAILTAPDSLFTQAAKAYRREQAGIEVR